MASSRERTRGMCALVLTITCQRCDRPIASSGGVEARRDAAMLYHLHAASRVAWNSDRQQGCEQRRPVPVGE
jgi:hypothetical protein